MENDYCFAQYLQFSMHNVISIIATSIMNKLPEKRTALPELPNFYMTCLRELR